MIRKIVGVTSALLLVVAGTLQLKASHEKLPAMTQAEMEAVVGADGWFEDCIEFETGCIEDPVKPDGAPCGNGCGAYCPGTQLDESCDDAWFPTSCTWIGQQGCDGIPYICGAGNKCVDANLGAGPNPILCGSYSDCD